MMMLVVTIRVVMCGYRFRRNTITWEEGLGGEGRTLVF